MFFLLNHGLGWSIFDTTFNARIVWYCHTVYAPLHMLFTLTSPHHVVCIRVY